MGVKNLSNNYLSTFTLELALLLQAGITMGDGLRLLIEDDDDLSSRALLTTLATEVDAGQALSTAMRKAGAFPDYMVHMTEIGEKTGRPEETFRAISDYYDSRERLNNSIRNTMLYPFILFLLMLTVIVVLLVKVLPIFNEVLSQMGSSLHGFAAGLLALGNFFSSTYLVFAVLLGLLLVFALAFWISPKARASLIAKYYDWRGDKGIAAKVSASRFSSAMSLSLRSGMNSEEALDMAASLTGQSRRMKQRFADCRACLNSGMGLAEALSQTGLFPAVYCRMLALGFKSGSTDTVIAEITRRLEESAEEEMNRMIGRVEPTLVIVTSLVVGLILLSVLLPLINIMSVIG